LNLIQKKQNKRLFFSIIIPVYNRPQEIDELLDSLTHQSYTDFEVIIVEDGSSIPSKNIIEKYKNSLQISYFYKENSGPGPSRNEGMKRAEGDYYIILDSDVIVPSHYLFEVNKNIIEKNIDAYGGPDKALENFTSVQKAIDFAMTSFLTTGGIRGKAEKFEKFHPRSFNMGLSKTVFKQTNGFSEMRYGEDIDFSIRIIKAGFKTALLKTAYVYHKRRSTLKQFYNQVYHSGKARINLYKKHPSSLKPVHFFPLLFSLGFIMSILLLVFNIKSIFYIYILYFMLIFILSSFKYKSIKIGFLSIISSFIMLWAYATGFLKEVVRKLFKKITHSPI